MDNKREKQGVLKELEREERETFRGTGREKER